MWREHIQTREPNQTRESTAREGGNDLTNKCSSDLPLAPHAPLLALRNITSRQMVSLSAYFRRRVPATLNALILLRIHSTDMSSESRIMFARNI